MSDLFLTLRPAIEEVYPQVFLLANFADSAALLDQINVISKLSTFRKMQTPNGHYTGIALTNCGQYGWVSDLQGYRYSAFDPMTGNHWPAIPNELVELATNAAEKAGYLNFIPDACLINQYPVGGKLGSHQDINEKNFDYPIVSVSIGLSATFQIYGMQRSGIKKSIKLHDGDVMVWGGESRLIYHAISAVKSDKLNQQFEYRYNLTFRCAN